MERGQRAWGRIDTWLRAHAPSTAAAVNPPADPAAIAAAEGAIGAKLPADLAASQRIEDGVLRETPFTRFALPYGYHPVPLAQSLKRWRSLVDILAGFEALAQAVKGDHVGDQHAA